MADETPEDRYQGCCLPACLKFSGDSCNRRKRRPGEDGSWRVPESQAGDVKTRLGNEKKRRNWYKLFQARTSGRKTFPVHSELFEEMKENDPAEEDEFNKATGSTTILKIVEKLECRKVSHLDGRVKAMPVPRTRVSEDDEGRKARKTSPEEIPVVMEISEEQAATSKDRLRSYSKDDPKSIRTRCSPGTNNTSRRSKSTVRNPNEGSRSIMGMSVLLIALTTLLLFGTPCAVICTSAWLCMVPGLTRSTKPMGCSQGKSRSGGRTPPVIAIKGDNEKHLNKTS
ncbi:uncharacterized protein LOC126409760 [Nymphaea colorata]|nr:uncharacterized protein LOC126409760 [Nymphaea colorata]